MNIQDTLIVTKEEIDEYFAKDILKDTNKGWVFKDKYLVQISAIHEIEPKYLNDVANAKEYKITIIDIINKDK